MSPRCWHGASPIPPVAGMLHSEPWQRRGRGLTAWGRGVASNTQLAHLGWKGTQHDVTTVPAGGHEAGDQLHGHSPKGGTLQACNHLPGPHPPPSPTQLMAQGPQQDLTSSNSAVSFCRCVCSSSRMASVRSNCVFSCVETPQTSFWEPMKDPLGSPGLLRRFRPGGFHLLAAFSVAASPCLCPAGVASAHQPAYQVISKASPIGTRCLSLWVQKLMWLKGDAGGTSADL